MNELEKQGFKAECTFSQEDNQFLAVLAVEGISERFSAYNVSNLAAKNASANLALSYIAKNSISAQGTSEATNIYSLKDNMVNDEAPNQMLKRLYPDSELTFESVCIVDVGGNKFESRGENRGTARVTAAAAALQALAGIQFENLDKFLEEKKNETREKKDIEKHPASALHEVVGQRALFTFDEEVLPDGMRKRFTCNVSIDDKLFSARASNKRLAKYNAAVTALNGLGLSKRFRLMGPPVEPTMGYNTGEKRRFDFGARGRAMPAKRRGGTPNYQQNLNSWENSNPFAGNYDSTPPRGGGRARGSFRARGSSSFRGRGGGQVVGDFSSAPPPAQQDYVMSAPGYGPPREPYSEFPQTQEMGGYNQGYNSDYTSGYQHPRPSPQSARGHAYSLQRGSTGFGAYQQSDPGYQYSY